MQILQFKTSREFRHWLQNNHAGSEGIWLRISRKDSHENSLTHAEALDRALCFGWIDGQKKSSDGRSWLQKFTPRRPASAWSKKNTEHVARLIKAGVTTPAGMQAVAAAKADGRWDAAYTAFGCATPPADFLQALRRNRKAEAFFRTLNRTNVYSIVYRLETARKPETREKRLKAILAMMAEGRAFHP